MMPKDHDEDLENADMLVNVEPGGEGAAAYATQAHAYATISIAKTLRRMETVARPQVKNFKTKVILTLTRDRHEIVIAISCDGYGGVIRFPIRYEEAFRSAFKPWIDQ